MDREKGDGNTILLTVIGVATLLVALVGATFAYFSAQVNDESKQSVQLSTAQPSGLVYAGKELILDNIIPGDQSGKNSDNGKFTVTNPADSAYDQTYDLSLVIDENTFEEGTTDPSKDQLELKITAKTAGVTVAKLGSDNPGVVSGSSITWNLTNGADSNGKTYQFVDDARIAKNGGVHEYLLEVEFKETAEPQDENQNKSFRAHVEISNPVSIE